MSWISFTSVVEARLSHWYVEGLRGYIRRGLLKASPHFAKMVNKTFVRNVNILRNVTHQHVHLHGVNMDHLTIIIVRYVLLGSWFVTYWGPGCVRGEGETTPLDKIM